MTTAPRTETAEVAPSETAPPPSAPPAPGLQPRRSGLLRRLNALLSPISHLSVILGIGVAGLAYVAENHRARVDASVGYINRFNTDRILDARNQVYLFWRRQSMIAVKNMERVDIDRLVQKGFDSSAPESHELPVVNIIDFFDGMQICIASGICDPAVLRSEFAPYAGNLWCLYHGFVHKQRDPLKGATPNFGKGLEAFVAEGRSCGTKAADPHAPS